jgi:hypothetical protein
MSIVLIYLAYLLISVGLTLLVGRALSQYGRVYLLDAVGGSDSAAEGISKLHVVAFYLLALGFVALTMRTTGDAGTARQAIQLLAAKIGEVLLVLGVLYLASLALLGQLRRRLRMQSWPELAGTPARPDAAAQPAAPARPTAASQPAPPAPATAAALPGPLVRTTAAAQPTPLARRTQPAQALWRPAPRKAAR